MKMYMVCACVLALTACGGAASDPIITGSSGDCCNYPPTPSPATDGGNVNDCCSNGSDAGNDATPTGSDAGPAACTEGTKQCNGTTAQTCTGGKFTDVIVCGGTSPVCDQGLCVECTTGQTDCVGTAPRSCVAGKWTYQPACMSGNAVCMDGTCVECSPGSSQCSGNTPQTCGPKGTWQSQTACSGSTPVCAPSNGSASCVACASGDGKCEGQDSYSCNASNQWVKNQTCSAVCLGKGSCVACAPNATNCPSDTRNAQTCSATGSWVNEQSSCDPGCTTSNRFKVDATLEIVTDSTTGYTWERDVVLNTDHSGAVMYCANLVRGPGTWRLPTVAEMQTLYIASAGCFYGIDGAVFPNSTFDYWTSTMGVQPNEHADYAYIGNNVSSDPDSLTNRYVTCIHN